MIWLFVSYPNPRQVMCVPTVQQEWDHEIPKNFTCSDRLMNMIFQCSYLYRTSVVQKPLMHYCVQLLVCPLARISFVGTSWIQVTGVSILPRHQTWLSQSSSRTGNIHFIMIALPYHSALSINIKCLPMLNTYYRQSYRAAAAMGLTEHRKDSFSLVRSQITGE